MQVIEQHAIAGPLEHFGVALREDTSAGDLACALASLVEGVWLHPTDPSQPIGTALRRSGRLLGRGATA